MFDPIELFANILQEFHDDSKWDDAVLGKIKTISNTKVGSVVNRRPGIMRSIYEH